MITRLLLGICSLFILSPIASAATDARKPNIILIFADDLGWKDVGYQGTDYYETPNIDRLAKQGTVFSAAYAAGANCAPSRACLISGQYTPRHGVYAVDSTLRGPKSLMRMVPIPNTTDLAATNVTVAEALKTAGYVTGIFGKWHLGGGMSAPAAQGFDEVFESHAGWNGNDPENPKAVVSLTRGACEFMEKNKDRPFFLYLAHYAIHSPIQSTAATLTRFKSKTPGRQHKDAEYAACIAELDNGIGTLLEKISSLGLDENTLVVFTSDNGATGQSLQEPLRGNKGAYYEGGIREPMIVRWPGVTKPGSKCDIPVINIDLYTTFLDAAGTTAPDGKILDGESILPLCRGGLDLKRSSIFWHFPGYLNGPVTRGRDPVFRTRPVSVIRKGPWKLFLYHEEWQLDGGRDRVQENHAVELYNLDNDPGERQDLAAIEQARRDELLNDLLKWMEVSKAPMTTEKNPDYNPTAVLEKPLKRSDKGE